MQFGRSQGHPVFPPPHTVKRLLDLSVKIIQNREFQRNAADMTINDLPYGRAERRGGPGLQTKFDQNYLPKLNVFRIKVDISERKELAESNLKLFLKWTRAGNDQFNSPFYARAHTREAG